MPKKEAEALLTQLRTTKKRSWVHQGYLQERYRVEAWLYQSFIDKGKHPYRRHPFYFVLGDNDAFFCKDGFFSDADPLKLQVPLSLFTTDMISFTYPDSMMSLGIISPPAFETLELYPRENGHLPTREEIEQEMRAFAVTYRKPWHGQVFTLEEIGAIVEQHGMPGSRWKDDPIFRAERYIEAQVWDERPILAYLSTYYYTRNRYRCKW